MSDENPFDRLFRPPTPEEQKAHVREAVRRRASLEARAREAIPMIREARNATRRLVAIGVGGPHLDKALRHLAMLEEDMETVLALPVDGQ